LPSGQVLEESWHIMAWAWEGLEAADWWDRAQSAANLALLACNDGEFKRQLDRYKYPERLVAPPVPGEGSSSGLGEPLAQEVAAVREGARAAAVSTLIAPLESRLQTQRFLGGDTPCATDVAIFPFVRQFAAVDTVWWEARPWPAVHAWLTAWVGTSLFQACMAKLPAQQVMDFPAWDAEPWV